ncbi:MAG: hypothetical protein FWG68_03575 [Defluviitaleaceae bacterium]|nr:hypothetical protein [Defluviitaleaceae bacterium]
MLTIVATRVLFMVGLILAIYVIARAFMNRAFRNFGESRLALAKADALANTARRRDVENIFYYTANLNELPFETTATEEIVKLQNRVKLRAAAPMIHFHQKFTNIELKTAYGAANLEMIALNEENYNKYIYALLKWAEHLLENGSDIQKKNAYFILERCVDLGSEHKKTYALLADKYAEKADKIALDNLLEKVSATFSDDTIRQNLANYITDKRGSL